MATKLKKMEPVAEWISEMKAKHIKLWVEGESLRYKAPKGVVSDEILRDISARKREIIEYIRAGDYQDLLSNPIPPAPEREYYPLSSPQRMMFVLSQIDKGSIAYNLTQILKISGNFDKNRLIKVIEQLIARHESLRTSFRLVEGEPAQIIHERVDFQLDYEEVDGDRELIQEIARDFVRPYDLSRPPLFRFKLVKIKSEKTFCHLLIQDMHHIIADGVSEAVLVQEVNQLYAGKSLPEVKVRYKDYALWQEKLLACEKVRAEEDFWREQLGGEIPVLNMATDYPRPSTFTFEGDSLKWRIGLELSGGLYRLARANQVTLFTVLLGAYNILLSKYSGQEEIIIGCPTAGRRHADLTNLIGVFVNTLALRNYPRPEKTGSQFLKETGKNVIKAFDNQDYPFEKLVEKINIAREPSRNPIFDVMFVLQNMDVQDVKAEGVEISNYEYHPSMAQVDMTLIAVESGEGIELEINYCTGLFKKETITQLAGHYQNILQEMVGNPEKKLGEIQMMSGEERRTILMEFNNTRVEYSREKTLQQLFEEQVRRTPENIALEFDAQSLTYRELNEKANQLARVLREKGTKPDTIVGVMTRRSMEMLIGIMAVLKAGGAYLPIDPEYPAQRVAYMLEDSQASILITQQGLSEDVRFKGQTVDVGERQRFQGSAVNLEIVNKSGDLAYMIYTSGSTGKPKGVMVEHRAVHNFFQGMVDRIGFGPGKTILALTTLSFDIFVLETLLPLSKGMKVVIANEDQQKDPDALNQLILKSGVNMLQATPSRMKLFLSNPDNQSCLKGLQEIMIGGEAFPLDLLIELQKVTASKIYNMYGPTETTVWSALKELTRETQITIGKPIANTRTYIMDNNQGLQPVAVRGELWIAGDGLARGYYRRNDLTAEKFVEDPFFPGEKMYRSGDLARWFPNGEIEYLGRLDHQVKIRGFRIELGEIEAQLLKYEAIKEAAVIDREDENGSKFLCAYITADKGVEITELKRFLSRFMPDFMIPSFFIPMAELPLTPNGKLDRKALPGPTEGINIHAVSKRPTNDMEWKLSAIWQEVLMIHKVGVDDNFFSLGGDSLKALTLISKIQQEFQVGLSINDLFKQPTIEELASLIVGENRLNSVKKRAEQGIVRGEIALLPIQKHFVGRPFSDKHHWNTSILIYSRRSIEETAFIKSVRKVVEHHDALRIVFRWEGASVRQYNRGMDEGELFDLKVVDLTDEGNDVERIIKETEGIHTSMDLTKGPLLKFGLFKTESGDHLLITIHHLVADGISMRFIIDDLLSGYVQALDNREIQLPPKTDSLMEWSQAVQQYANSPRLLQELDYWKSVIETEVPPLPKDGHAASDRMLDSDCHQISLLSAEESARLLKVSRQSSRDIKILLLAGLEYAFQEWSGNRKISVTLLGHGREKVLEDLDITRTCGWIDVGYPVVLEMKFDDDISGQVDHIKETLMKIPNNGMGHDVLRFITSPENKRSLEFKLKPDILFNFLGQVGQEGDDQLAQFTVSPISDSLGALHRTVNQDRDHTFEMNLIINENGLEIQLNYNQYEYRKSTIETIIHGYRGNLQRIISHYMEKQ